MYYGIQLATSGVMNGFYRADVLANNLANTGTTGFKPDFAFARQRDPARVEDGVRSLPSNELLEALGAGAHAAPNRTIFAQGPIKETGNPLELAIDGGGFLALRDRDPANPAGLVYTRDGRLTLAADGTLVQATTGREVLGELGTPITLDPAAGPVQIDSRGAIRQAGAVVARLRFEDVADRAALEKVGDSAFRPGPNADADRRPAEGRIVAGALEGSAVNEIRALLAVQSATRSVGSNIGMIQYQDRMMDRAINTFARLA